MSVSPRSLTSVVQVGAVVLERDVSAVGRARCGLITNFTGVMPDLTRNVDRLMAAGLNLGALFGPEHGLRGSVQAGSTEFDEVDSRSGLPLFDTYLKDSDELDSMLAMSGVDTLIFDMQDIGARFYTYVWTMFDCMMAAARAGMRFVVLDRPNPIGGTASNGPRLRAPFASFVGRADIPLRHGLTVGELAQYLAGAVVSPATGRSLDLQVVRMENWRRDGLFDHTGLPWVPPSPNIPTLDSALVFAGMGLIEGTNLSEGRGTTHPFETIGAPYIDERLIGELSGLDVPGVLFRETWFVPTFHKYAGTSLRGFQLHVTDRETFDPIDTALAVIHAVKKLYPSDFAFLPPGERDDNNGHGYAIDRLWGSDELRLAVERGDDPRSLSTAPESPVVWCGDAALLY
jgi:uncharacterized protein YbbC (DUF1343 family)